MKTLKFLLATLAVSFAFSATAFAAELSDAYNYTFDLKVSPATVNAGETIEVSVFLSATDASGNPIDTLAETGNTDSMTLSLGLDYDASVLTWADNDVDGMYTDTKLDPVDLYYTVVDNGGNLGFVLTEQYRKIGAIAPDTALLTYKFKVADNAATATYNASKPLVALKSDTTSYANSTKVTSTLNKTLNVPAVSVVGSTPTPPPTPTVSANKTESTNVDVYTFENSDDMAGKRVLMTKATTAGSTISEKTRFKVTYEGQEPRIYGSDIWEKLKAQGGGTIAAETTVKFGIVVTDNSLDAAKFTFEVITLD